MAFVELPVPAALPIAYPTFTKRMRVTHTWSCLSENPNWLAATEGEIVRTTNDKPRNQSYVVTGKSYEGPAYEAVDDAGQRGFVHPYYVELVDYERFEKMGE